VHAPVSAIRGKWKSRWVWHPSEELRLQFEALSRLDQKEKEVVIEVLDGLLLKRDAKRQITREKAS